MGDTYLGFAGSPLDTHAQASEQIAVARRMHSLAKQAVAAARLMHQDTRLQVRELAQDDPFRRRYRDAILGHLLESTMKGTGAKLGNIQLVDPTSGRLVIHVNRGFDDKFLEFFNEVEEGQAACGVALQSGRQQIIEDAADSAIFAGSASLEALLDANVRAVQSTPLCAGSGKILGMLSTHHHSVHRPSRKDLRKIQFFSQFAADIIDWCGPVSAVGPTWTARHDTA